jgi:hypothetical protein
MRNHAQVVLRAMLEIRSDDDNIIHESNPWAGKLQGFFHFPL